VPPGSLLAVAKTAEERSLYARRMERKEGTSKILGIARLYTRRGEELMKCTFGKIVSCTVRKKHHERGMSLS